MTRLITGLGLSLMAAGIAFPSMAEDVSGEWQFQRQAYNGVHSGTIILDRQGGARLKATGPIQTYVQCGYVRVRQGAIEIVFTYAKGEKVGYNADHFYCTNSSKGSFGCYNIDAGGTHEPIVFPLTRVGGVPATPAGRLENVCAAKTSPNA